MQCDLAVGARAKPMALALEFVADGLIAVEFAIDDDPHRFVFVGDRLNTRPKIDDAQSRMAKGDPSVLADPAGLGIRAAVPEASRGALDRRRLDPAPVCK